MNVKNIFENITSIELNIICIRNLGDSFIQKKFIEDHFIGNGIRVNIFCREECAPVFNDGKFNVFKIKIQPSVRSLFKWSELQATIKSIKHKDGVYISFFGDWLELILLTLSGVRFFYPVWPKSHYLRKILRIPKFRYPFGVGVDICNENLYLSFEKYARYISSLFSSSSKLMDREKFDLINSINVQPRDTVVFSPIGSVSSKTLSNENINGIIELCSSMDCTVILMCSETQKNSISKCLRSSNQVKFCTNIADGVSFLKTSRCYIGVDTFWTHVAICNNIPTLLFSGAIPAKFIYPEVVNELTYGNQCAYYPCFNFSPCKNKKESFVCIGSGLQLLTLKRVREFLAKHLITN
jgi:ADP-heptose:LPS heptosyltransferase